MIHEFEFTVYPRKLWVTYDATPDELNEAFPSGDSSDRRFRDFSDFAFAETNRVADEENKGGVLIRFLNKERMTASNIAHEAVHAANFIYDHIGAQHDVINDEPYAYLVGYIAKCCEIAKEFQDEKKEQNT